MTRVHTIMVIKHCQSFILILILTKTKNPKADKFIHIEKPVETERDSNQMPNTFCTANSWVPILFYTVLLFVLLPCCQSSIDRPASIQPAQGIFHHATSSSGRRLYSKRRECIHITHPRSKLQST